MRRRGRRRIRGRGIHSGDAVVLVAGYVEPGAGVNESGIPALENVVGVGEAPAEGEQRVALGVGGGRGGEEDGGHG